MLQDTPVGHQQSLANKCPLHANFGAYTTVFWCNWCGWGDLEGGGGSELALYGLV